MSLKQRIRFRKHKKSKEKSITYYMRGVALFQQKKRIGNIRESLYRAELT